MTRAGDRPDRPPVDLNAGVLAPVTDEVTLGADDLPVTGTIPAGLDGTLIRNGPNPFSGRFDGESVLDWWPEPAMFHAVTIEAGKAVRYRNRWARTQAWTRHHRPTDATTATDHATVEPLDTNPNVHLIHHADELLAMAEGGAPLRIDRDLQTLGPTITHPVLAAGSTAHPKVDPETGELISFLSGWAPPYLRYLVTAADGTATLDTTIDLPHSVMLHDLAITATRSVLFDLNVGYDLSMLAGGHRIPIRWHADRAARIGILPRHGDQVRWFEIEPCFVQHVVNAFDAGEDGMGDRMVIDAVRYPWYFRVAGDGAGFDPDPLGVLWRWTIDLDRGTVTEGPVETGCPFDQIELPRIDESRTGRPNRHLWAVEQPSSDEMRGLRHHDRTAETTHRWVPPPGDQNSEPVFAPRPGATDEGDGWIVAAVYRAATDTTDVVVLDALDLAAGPVATIHLPVRIPAGFHGVWLPN